MSNPFDFFDKIYCINLPERADRWAAVSKEFEKVGILDRVEQIWTTPPPADFKMSNFHYRGEFGVNLSQMKAVVHGIGSKNVLIFEDDIAFIPGTESRVGTAIHDLPDDWGVFLLGGRPMAPLTKVTNNIAMLSDFVQASSYAIRGELLTEYYDFFSEQVTAPFPDGCYDKILSDFTLKHSGYCMYPPVCHQVGGHSSIRSAQRDYRDITTRDWDKFKP